MLSLFRLFLFVTGVFLFGIHAVSAVEYGQLGARPAHSDPNIPNSNAWFIYTLSSGETRQDSVLFSNISDTPYMAQVYAADSVSGSDGGFALAQFSEQKQDVGSWVRFYPDPAPNPLKTFLDSGKEIKDACAEATMSFKQSSDTRSIALSDQSDVSVISEWCAGKEWFETEIAANEIREVPFVLTLPAETLDAGEHTGGIVIQKKPTEATTNHGGSKVLLTIRVGTRIYVTVPGEIRKTLLFDQSEVKKNFSEFFLPWDRRARDRFGRYLILSTIHNEGNVQTEFEEKIIIRDALFGWRSDEIIDERRFQVLRGDTFLSSLDWKAPRFGRLTFEKEYRYIDAAGKEIIEQKPLVTRWFLPVREFSISVLMGMLIGMGYGIYRWYWRYRYGGVGWVKYEVKEGDNLWTLSEKFHVSWRVLARTNRVIAPYLLVPKGHILVPPMHGMSFDSEKEDILSEIQPATSVNAPSTSPRFVTVPLWIWKVKSMCLRVFRCIIVERAKWWALFGVLMLLGVIWFFALNHRRGPIVVENTSSLRDSVVSDEDRSSILVSENVLEDTGQEVGEAIDIATLKVRVVNGGAAQGSAAKAKTFLQRFGYKQLSIENSRDLFVGNTVLYVSGYEKAAVQIGELMRDTYNDVTLKVLDDQKTLKNDYHEAQVIIVLGASQ